jgi:hypothetical protein
MTKYGVPRMTSFGFTLPEGLSFAAMVAGEAQRRGVRSPDVGSIARFQSIRGILWP